MTTTDPVTIAEAPWIDPWDGHLSGAHRRRLIGQDRSGDDHLVVYLRGVAGDADREYVAPTTICGLPLDDAIRPERLSSACRACLEGAGRAFARARLRIAEATEPRLE